MDERGSPQGVIDSLSKVDDRFVVEEDGEILGFGDRKNDELTGIYVSADAQGQGAGSMLLDKLLSCMREDGFICARANATLTARGFYEKNGFVAIKEFMYQGRHTEIACVLMQKLL